jgi:hypothetical protein
MPERFTVTLPLPPKALSPNAHAHWRQRQRAAKAYRAHCALLFRSGIGRALPTPITWSQEYFASRSDSALGLYHTTDNDSALAATKVARDALQDAGIIHTDSRKNLRIGACELYTTARECKGAGRIVVTIEAGA